MRATFLVVCLISLGLSWYTCQVTHEEQLRELAQNTIGRSTSEIFAARWRTLHESQPIVRDKLLPPFVHKEILRRSNLTLDVLDAELEKRWLAVAPALRIGNDGKIKEEGEAIAAFSVFTFGS